MDAGMPRTGLIFAVAGKGHGQDSNVIQYLLTSLPGGNSFQSRKIWEEGRMLLIVLGSGVSISACESLSLLYNFVINVIVVTYH